MAKTKVKKEEKDYIKFLGTAGARFVMIEQLRASGGIWISCKGTNVLIDPGPGSLVRCAASRPRLAPAKLDGIILTHKHLDHSGDLSVMIEGMTEGGFKKKGVLFVPADAMEEDPVVLNYLRGFPEKIVLLTADGEFQIGAFSFKTSMRHIHPSETYGFKFNMGGTSIGLLADTKYFEGIYDFYKTDILIIGVVFFEPRPGIEHLCLPDAREIIARLKPKKAILTHFGMGMLKAKPHLQAEKLSKETGVEVVAAYDGMKLEFV